MTEREKQREPTRRRAPADRTTASAGRLQLAATGLAPVLAGAAVPSHAQLRSLQRVRGNAAVGRLLRAADSAAGVRSPTGGAGGRSGAGGRGGAGRPLLDLDGSPYRFHFEVGSDVSPRLLRTAQQLAARGPMTDRQHRLLRDAAHSEGPIGDVQRLFLAGVRQPANLQLLRSVAGRPGATVEFTLDAPRNGRRRRTVARQTAAGSRQAASRQAAPPARRSGDREPAAGRLLQRAPMAPSATTAAGPDLTSGISIVTTDQHAAVEAVLHPGSVAVGGTVTPPPAATGLGKGGPFETDMLAALDTAVGSWAAAFNALKSAGPPSFPIAQANDIAAAAQAEVEAYFGPLIQSASRQTADKYHPGTYSLASKLGDESKRPLDAGNRLGWTGYWMTLRGVGADVLDKYHVLENRDSAEFNRVLQKFALDPARKAKIDDAIHGWPAEAGTGTVFIQPYTDPAPSAQRAVRWDIFTTLIHEMMHVVAHPNFERTSTAVGGSAQKFLTEGFADLMRHDLWFAGGLKDRLALPAAAPLRAKVEGAVYPYDASVIVYHSEYDEIAQANKIKDAVGLDNCKAAFFLGRTELLGIGAGTGSVASLSGIAGWTTSDNDAADMYDAVAGDTVAVIALKCGVDPGSVHRADGSALPAGFTPTPGMKLQVDGIIHLHAVAGDTLGSLAQQNGVTPESIAAANGFPATSNSATAVVAGRRILIPVRKP